MTDRSVLLPLSAAALGVACLATIPGALAIQTQIRDRTPKDNFYQDQDGVSTPEALAAFSNRTPKTTILLLSVLGFASLTAVSIQTAVDPSHRELLLESWLATASSVSRVQSAHPCVSLA